MQMAEVWATNSHSTRAKVGALIVKDISIISDGYNGTPAGFDNRCETKTGQTLFYVLHAEANAIAKLATGTNSSTGSTLYVTMSPCVQCAKLIIQAKISRVVYREQYRDVSGILLLEMAKIKVDRI